MLGREAAIVYVAKRPSERQSRFRLILARHMLVAFDPPVACEMQPVPYNF